MVIPPQIFCPSLKFIKRLRSSYCSSINEENGRGKSVLWSNIIPNKQENIHQALLNSDEACLSLFSDMLSHDLYYGVENHCLSIWGSSPSIQRIHFNSQLLINLATSVGILDKWNPRGGSKNPHRVELYIPNDLEILQLLDEHFGFALTFPEPFIINDSNGDRGWGNSRGVQAIYQAYRMRQASNVVGGIKFLEIGGGMGRTAFYANKFGLADFTAIDIPLGMVRQACFLAATLGENAIWLYGDPPPLNDNLIKIAPPSYLFNLNKNFDIALNVDSLTEMSFEDAKKYIVFLRNSTRVFISINHEANDFRIRDLWADMWRHAYPLRDGYVEEIGFSFS